MRLVDTYGRSSLSEWLRDIATDLDEGWSKAASLEKDLEEALVDVRRIREYEEEER